MLTQHHIVQFFTHLQPFVMSQLPDTSQRESNPHDVFGGCSVFSLPHLPSYVWTASASLLQIICLSIKIQVTPKQEGFVYLDLKLTHVYFLISSTTNKKQGNSS